MLREKLQRLFPVTLVRSEIRSLRVDLAKDRPFLMRKNAANPKIKRTPRNGETGSQVRHARLDKLMAITEPSKQLQKRHFQGEKS
jgi:hypothetical protein